MTQILNVSSLVSKPVDLVTAGDDQVAICEPIVYLEATFDGDLSRHYTQWEQISGTPIVVLEAASPTQVYYTVPGAPGTDKVFRFWIDRGTPFEQFQDVNVRTTPTSVARTFSTGTNDNNVYHPDYALVAKEYVLAASPFDYNVPHNSAFSFAGLDTTLLIPEPTYTRLTMDDAMASYAVRYSGIVAESWNGTTWVNVGTYAAGNVKELMVDLPARLRFGVIYARSGREAEIAYHLWNDYTGLGAAQEVVGQAEMGLLGNDVTLTRLVHRRETRTDDDTTQPFEVGVLKMDYALTRIIYRLVTLTGTDENADQYEVGLLRNSFTVTRIAGGNLGG